MRAMHLAPVALLVALLHCHLALAAAPPAADWDVVPVPGNWRTVHGPHDGFAWYRYLVRVPDDWRDKPLSLKLSYISDSDEAFFNGTKVGATGTMPPNFKSGHGPFRQYVVPPQAVRPGKVNLIAVRVYKQGDGPAGISHGPVALACNQKEINLEGIWQFHLGDDPARARWPVDPNGPDAERLLGEFRAAADNPIGHTLARVGLPPSPWLLWYKRPAAHWDEALPIGNGRLGAMVFGGVRRERLQLNEDTLWSGGPRGDADRPDAWRSLPEIRKLIFEGKYAEAERLTNETMTNRGGGYDGAYNAAYQTLGDLSLSFPVDSGPVEDYRRYLDLDAAVAGVSYRIGEATFKRETFSSPADQVIAMRVTCDRPGQIALTARLGRVADAEALFVKPNRIIMRGRCDGGTGMKFEAQLRIVAPGGRISGSRNRLRISGADEAVLLLVAATDYRGKDPTAECEKTLAEASRKSFRALREEHVAEHRRLFRRVDLQLGWNLAVRQPTDVRLGQLRQGKNDPHLLPLFFQYGRYLLISSSRPGCMPANRQGLWADGLKPPWHCDYRTNVHLQMNYWPAETCNLAECHRPLFDLIESLRVPGRRTARAYFNAPGFVCHAITNAWGWTSPGWEARWGWFPTGGAWLCRHLWEHYEFGRDKEFLRQAYPTLKEACEFFLATMVPDRDGRLVTAPSTSPENRFGYGEGQVASVCAGSSVDRQIVWDLFGNTIEASEVLGIDEAYRKRLTDARNRIRPPEGGRHNQLKQWTEDFDEPWPFHRHLSHLFALYPGRQITPRQTQDPAARCRETLNRRLQAGGGLAGFSRAWIAGCFARLEDHDQSHRNLVALLAESTLPNLLCNGPPMQIDGNLGATAAIAETLLHSHAGEIYPLPALSRQTFPDGRFRGLCARGGLEVDARWSQGIVKSLILRAHVDGTHRIRPPSGHTISEVFNNAEPLEVLRDNEGVITLEVHAGETYDLKL